MQAIWPQSNCLPLLRQTANDSERSPLYASSHRLFGFSRGRRRLSPLGQAAIRDDNFSNLEKTKMQTKQAITKKLATSTEKAWNAIRNIDGLERWFPIIGSCRVDGSGIGARRSMALEQGGEIVDLIEDIDSEQKRLVYLRTVSPFPVTHYRGTVEVFDSYDGQAIVSWTIDFESKPEDSAGVAELVRNAIADGIDGMERELR